MRRSSEQYAKILFQLTRDVSGKALDEATHAFALLLQREHAMTRVDAIVRAYTDLAQEAVGVQSADVRVARTFSAQKLKSLLTLFGRTIEARVTVDESLLGGMIIRTKDTILDASLRTQLKRLEHHLTS